MATQTKINWIAILFWGAIIGTIGLVLIFYRNNILDWVQNPELPNISNLPVDNITQFADKYGAIIGLAGTGIVTVYGFYQKHKASVAQTAQLTAEKEATRIELEANSKISHAETAAKDYKNKYETLLNTQDNTLLLEAQQTVTQQAEKIKSLRTQVQFLDDKLEQEIQKRPVITKEVIK